MTTVTYQSIGNSAGDGLFIRAEHDLLFVATTVRCKEYCAYHSSRWRSGLDYSCLSLLPCHHVFCRLHTIATLLFHCNDNDEIFLNTQQDIQMETDEEVRGRVASSVIGATQTLDISAGQPAGVSRLFVWCWG